MVNREAAIGISRDLRNWLAETSVEVDLDDLARDEVHAGEAHTRVRSDVVVVENRPGVKALNVEAERNR